MSTSSGGSKIQSLLAAVKNWRSGWTKRRHLLNTLSELNEGAEVEIERMANDLGVPSAEIKQLHILVSRYA